MQIEWQDRCHWPEEPALFSIQPSISFRESNSSSLGFASLRHLPLVMEDSNVSRPGQRINTFTVSLFGKLYTWASLLFSESYRCIPWSQEGSQTKKNTIKDSRLEGQVPSGAWIRNFAAYAEEKLEWCWQQCYLSQSTANPRWVMGSKRAINTVWIASGNSTQNSKPFAAPRI